MEGLLLNWCCGISELNLEDFIVYAKRKKVTKETLKPFIQGVLKGERVVACVITGAKLTDDGDRHACTPDKDLKYMQSLGLKPRKCGRNPKTRNEILLWVIK